MVIEKEIRAFYSENFIRVYQAFNNIIANSAVKHQKFISPPFKRERTTWIKPSFLWMMYRSNWGTKDNQKCILAIDITHEGFLWALSNSCLSHFDKAIYGTEDNWRKLKGSAPVVIQWDPERDIFLNKLDYRTIQIGLSPEASLFYTSQWIIRITDITDTTKKIRKFVEAKKMEEAKLLLPLEKRYNIPNDIKHQIGVEL